MKLRKALLLCLFGCSAAFAENCTVIPLGHGRSDSEQIVDVFNKCGKGGVISFPAPYVYTIGSKVLAPASDGATIKIGGTMQFTQDIAYWIRNESTFPIELQNQVSAWRWTGGNFTIDGSPSSNSSDPSDPDNFGVIDGGGQAWYSYSRGQGNLPGRPMTFDFLGVENVVVRNLKFVQPQFWTMIVEESKNVTLEHIWINATNSDPSANNTDWVQNTDGVDTWRTDNVLIQDFHYIGGDDCVAFKGNSTNILVRNVTCTGGPGIAFGSIGQYPATPDYLENITVESVTIERPGYSGVGLGQNSGSGVYFKSWIGVPVGTPPNGGGGGTGLVKNITVKDIHMTDIDVPVYITSCLSYTLDMSGGTPDMYCNTSTLAYDGIRFSNITGTSSGINGDIVAAFNCSSKAPCKNLVFDAFDVVPGGSAAGEKPVVGCENVESIQGVKCW